MQVQPIALKAPINPPQRLLSVELVIKASYFFFFPVRFHRRAGKRHKINYPHDGHVPHKKQIVSGAKVVTLLGHVPRKSIKKTERTAGGTNVFRLCVSVAWNETTNISMYGYFSLDISPLCYTFDGTI